MKTCVWRSISLSIAFLGVALLALLTSHGVKAQSVRGNPTITIIISGQQRAVHAGDKIPLPTTDKIPPRGTTSTLCYLDNVALSVVNAPGMSSGGAAVQTTDKCEIVIQEIAPASDTPLKPPSDGSSRPAITAQPPLSASLIGTSIGRNVLASAVTRNGWATAEYHEQAGIHVSEARARLTYDDDGTTAFNARSPSGTCWWQSATGWGNTRCARSDDLAHIKTHTEGDFTHTITVYNHTLGVTFEGRPAGVTGCTVNFTGWKPALWGFSCASGR